MGILSAPGEGRTSELSHLQRLWVQRSVKQCLQQTVMSAPQHSALEKQQQHERASYLFGNVSAGNSPLASYSGKKCLSLHCSFHLSMPVSLPHSNVCASTLVLHHTVPSWTDAKGNIRLYFAKIKASLLHWLWLALVEHVSSRDIQPQHKCFTKLAIVLGSQRGNGM